MSDLSASLLGGSPRASEEMQPTEVYEEEKSSFKPSLRLHTIEEVERDKNELEVLYFIHFMSNMLILKLS